MMIDTISRILMYAGIVMGIVFGICYFHQNFYIGISVLFSTIFKPKKKIAKQNHKYGFIICARNESSVIEDLIESIRSQDYPSELIKIYVMADNCTDNTAELARKAGASVYERFNTEKVGKGYAMEVLFDHLIKDEEAMSCEGFFIFDADNILDKNYVARMNDEFDNGVRIGLGFRNTRNFNDGWVAVCNAYYFCRDCYIMHRTRTLLHSSTLVTGTGWMVHSDIIKRENGWHYDLISEDVQFIIDQIAKGEKAVYCHDAIFYDEQPALFSQSWKQRKRWIKGMTQVVNRYGGRLFKGIFTQKGSRFTCYDLFLTMFSSGYVTAAGTLVGVTSCLFNMFTANSVLSALTILGIYLGGLYVTFFLMVLIPVIACWKRIALGNGKKIWYMFVFPIFMCTYLPLTIVSILSRNVYWEPIHHYGEKNKKTVQAPTLTS